MCFGKVAQGVLMLRIYRYASDPRTIILAVLPANAGN